MRIQLRAYIVFRADAECLNAYGAPSVCDYGILLILRLALSTERTNAHRVDSYFLHLTMHT